MAPWLIKWSFKMIIKGLYESCVHLIHSRFSRILPSYLNHYHQKSKEHHSALKKFYTSKLGLPYRQEFY